MTDVLPIALDRLILSRLNVRRTERDADIAALAEDIAARGLKQNLVVTPAHYSTGEGTSDTNVDWAYQLEVVAGGRRLQALQLLAAAGRIPADHPVPCLLDPREQARETSLSENLHRVAMNPADEFDAFATIVEQNGGGEAAIELCARRFGATTKHVEGRLRLATLAPEILEALRAGNIGLESAKAYAGTTDQALQVKVFKAQAKSGWKPHDPATVRQGVRGDTISLGDSRLKFVGLQAYRAAGGRTEVEMFMGSDGEERALDGKLLDRLAKEKAEPLVGPAAKRDGFKAGLLAAGVGQSARWPKPPTGFERQNHWEQTPTKAQLKKSIAVYAILYDGSGIDRIGHFRPERQQQDRGYKAETAEERAAAQRARAIDVIAAQMAVPKFTGTPLERRAYWPAGQGRWINEVEQRADGTLMVAVLVQVPAADRDAQREAAAARWDELQEEAAAERAAREAAAADGSEHQVNPADDFAGDFADEDDEADELAA